MPKMIKFLFITLLCFPFWNINALQNKKPEKKKKSAPTKKLYDCKNFQQGKFTYTNNSGFKILIIRETGFHIQYRNYPNDYIKQDIEWLSDCKYKLKITEIHDSIVNSKNIGGISIVEIGEKRSKDFYEYTTFDEGKIISGTVYVIKD